MGSWVKDVPDYDHSQCYPVEPDCPEEMPENDDCVNCENRCHLSHVKCQPCETDPCQVMATDDVFASCRVDVDPERYIPQCQYDVALLTNSTEVKCNPCNSASVQQFASECEEAGKCVAWRTALGCPVSDCPANQEFRECDTNSLRYRSCDNLTVWDDGTKVDGCFCPEGQVRQSSNSDICVPAQCCFGCPPQPKCAEESTLKESGDMDACGCPAYYCERSQCSTDECPDALPSSECGLVTTTQSGIAMEIDGELCISTADVDTQLCGGMCSSATTMTKVEDKTTTLDMCSSCRATETEMKTIQVVCPSAGTKEVEIESHVACACNESPCA